MMSDIKNLKGSIVALVTPMKAEDNSVDEKALKELVEWHIEEGTKGIVACGTTGEAPTLQCNEWEKVVRICVETSSGRIPIIAGTGTNCTSNTITKTKRAQELGANAALVVTPYYNKPSQEGLITHYKTVAESASEMPIILYNVPGRTGCDMLPETIATLSKIPNIIGNKEASGKEGRMEKQIEICKKGFLVYSGEDSQACNAIINGAAGVISVTANVAPKFMSIMCEKALKKSREAKELDTILAPLHSLLFIESNPVPTKWLLFHMGKIPSGIRLPLLTLSSENRDILIEAWRNFEVAEKKEMGVTV